MNRSPITTHVLDTSAGNPAQGIDVVLEFISEEGSATEAGSGSTNEDGRISNLVAEDFEWKEGVYRLTFDIESYQEKIIGASFYPVATITFRVVNTDQHYHIPLLLSPFGYTTYRGS